MSGQNNTHAHISSIGAYLAVFGAMIVRLFLTVGAGFVNLGPLNINVAMTIANLKAVLVVLYFMHVRYSTKLTMVTAAAGFVWLILLLGITAMDYVSRHWSSGAYH